MTNSSKVCVVTGGSMGIGLALCQKFCAEGYQVYNLDIEQTEAGLCDRAQWRYCDMSNCAQIASVLAAIIAQTGRVDVLISNAGMHYSATLEDTSEEDLDKVFSLNIKGAYGAIKAVLPVMKARQEGAIILMASDQALVAKHNSFAYNLSKAALASMAKTTALDYAKYGIRANAVCPGTIETPLYHKAISNYVARTGADEAQIHAEEAALQPLGRIGQPQEVADLCYFLASDQARFITGSLQVIDGGYTAQ